MTDPISKIIAITALCVSVTTLWLTLLRRGRIRMTQPTTFFFGPDGAKGLPKVYLRTLLYSTGKRGQIVESMFVKLRRGESVQTFNIWVYGAASWLAEAGFMSDTKALLAIIIFFYRRMVPNMISCRAITPLRSMRRSCIPKRRFSHSLSYRSMNSSRRP